MAASDDGKRRVLGDELSLKGEAAPLQFVLLLLERPRSSSISDDAERDEFRVLERLRESLLLADKERASNEEEVVDDGADVVEPDAETGIGDRPRLGEFSGESTRVVGLSEGE